MNHISEYMAIFNHYIIYRYKNILQICMAISIRNIAINII